MLCVCFKVPSRPVVQSMQHSSLSMKKKNICMLTPATIQRKHENWQHNMVTVKPAFFGKDFGSARVVFLLIMWQSKPTFYFLEGRGGLWMKSLSVTIQIKPTEQYFLWCCLLCCKGGSNF